MVKGEETEYILGVTSAYVWPKNIAQESHRRMNASRMMYLMDAGGSSWRMNAL